MRKSGPPRLTIGVPLHRSRPFVDVVSANIAAVDREDVEFLVSDRTALDDAVEALAARHAGDRRMVWLRTADGVDWVDHCNALLRRARGAYFCWMPHDDSFPPDWVAALLSCLEGDPGALMAFGRVEPIVADGGPTGYGRYRHPDASTGRDAWSVDDAVAMLTRWKAGYAFRGMFRRDPVIARGLYLPRTRDGYDADVAWIFGMALLGRLRYVPEVSCLKRYYAASAHRTWKRRPAHHLSLGWALARCAIRYGGSVDATLTALAAATRLTARRLAKDRWRRGSHLLRRVHRGARRLRRGDRPG